jgi:hypothetical protein
MITIEQQKIKLEQRKNRLLQEEVRLKLKERKSRTRKLIELGGLVVKAELNNLPINILFGALLSLAETLKNNHNIKNIWESAGRDAFAKDRIDKIAVILKLDEQVDTETKDNLRKYGLVFNRFRSEYYGYVTDLDSFKKYLVSMKYELEIIPN